MLYKQGSCPCRAVSWLCFTCIEKHWPKPNRALSHESLQWGFVHGERLIGSDCSAARVQAMQAAAQVTELEVPLQSRVAWLRKNYSYFEDEHKDLLMAKLDALTKTSGKKVC